MGQRLLGTVTKGHKSIFANKYSQPGEESIKLGMMGKRDEQLQLGEEIEWNGLAE